MGPETGGEGDDNQAGDKGQIDGDPYAPSYFGQPGSQAGGGSRLWVKRSRKSNQIVKLFQNVMRKGVWSLKIDVDKNREK